MKNEYTFKVAGESFPSFKKTLIIMKLITLFLIVGLMQVSASVYSQFLKVEFSQKSISIKDVIMTIEKNSDYKILYRNDQIDVNRLVEITSPANSLDNILSQVLNNTNLTYKILENNLVVFTPLQQKIIIKGIVQDSQGNTLPGVTISVKGTKKVSITDIYGNYSIQINNNDKILVFSFIGMKKQEVLIGSQTAINVVMDSEASTLDEVVVVGYGQQKKYSVVGSITTISPEKLKAGTTRSVSNNLAGQLSGIIAVQRSGEPGYDNSSFWIRGISTFGGTKNPLVLVDGIERSLDNMDPEEIASFSILKDASASAVYGVRGANGVVLINTKRGEVGKPKVTVRTEQGFTQPIKLPKFIGAAQYLETMNSISTESGKVPLYTQERIDNIRNKVDPDLYPDVNWLDLITKDQASNSRTNFSVSGGSNTLRYSMVASYYGENGIIERDKTKGWDSSLKLRRYNVRSNVDLNLSPTTLLRFNIGGYMQDLNSPGNIDGMFAEAFTIPPYVHPAIYSSGEIPRTPQRSNPWALATQSGYVRSSASKLESLFSIEQDLKALLPGLKAKVTFSFDRYSKNYVNRTKSPDYYNPATGRDANGKLLLTIANYGQAFLGYSTSSDWGDKSTYIESNITYGKEFGKHSLDFMFVANRRQYDNGGKLPSRNQGLAGRASYSYAKRYIAEFNFGYNGSENFAAGKRYGFFPSVAGGWLLSEEPFMTPLKKVLSKVKLRGSYGLVGNDKLDGRTYAYITTIGDTDGYTWGINNDYYRAGRREGDYGIPNLTWETVTKTDLGIELGLFNSIEIQADLFKEMRRDIFMQRKTIPGSSGFINMPFANFGKVDNKGIDLSIDVNKQITKDLFISVRGTLTYAVNTIIEQDEPSTVIGTNRSSTGKSVGQIFGLVADGLFTDADFANVGQGILADNIPIHSFGPVRPGDIKYKDINNDNRIDALDNCAIGGTYDPQLVYGFGSNIRYKAFDLGFFFQGLGKTYRIIGGSNFIPGSANGSMGNILTNVVDRWTVDNPRQDVFWPRLSDSQSSNNNQASTWWLRDMSFLRLKNAELGYNFPKKMLAKAYLSNARLFLRGTNLLTFSKFTLWDPEVDAANGLRYPIMKSVSVGLELNF